MRCCWFPTQLWRKIFSKKGWTNSRWFGSTNLEIVSTKKVLAKKRYEMKFLNLLLTTPPCSKPENPTIDDWWTWFWEKKVTIEKKTSLPFTPQRGLLPTLSRDGAMFRVWEVQVPHLNIPKTCGENISIQTPKQVSFQNPPKNTFIGNHQVVGKTTTTPSPSPNALPSFSPHSQGSDGSATGHSRRHFA